MRFAITATDTPKENVNKALFPPRNITVKNAETIVNVLSFTAHP